MKIMKPEKQNSDRQHFMERRAGLRKRFLARAPFLSCGAWTDAESSNWNSTSLLTHHSSLMSLALLITNQPLCYRIMKLLPLIPVISPSLLVLFRYFLLSNNDSTSYRYSVSALSTSATQQVFRRHYPLRRRQPKSGRIFSETSVNNLPLPRPLAHRKHDADADDDDYDDDASSTPPLRNLGDDNSSKNQHARKHQPMCYRRHKVPNNSLTFAPCIRLMISTMILPSITPTVAHAAPPIAIIAEELGYFPVTNTAGETVYVPKRVQRESSQQAIELARRLQEKGVAMAGTYWCPHTSRQKELFGKQAWEKIRYLECSPKGYNTNAAFCVGKQVDGYPTWLFPGGKQVSGERPLSVLAKEVGMTNFRDELETNVPPLPGSACQ